MLFLSHRLTDACLSPLGNKSFTGGCSIFPSLASCEPRFFVNWPLRCCTLQVSRLSVASLQPQHVDVQSVHVLRDCSCIAHFPQDSKKDVGCNEARRILLFLRGFTVRKRPVVASALLMHAMSGGLQQLLAILLFWRQADPLHQSTDS